jgi:hypothetical protein
MYLTTLSPAVSRLKNQLINDAVEVQSAELWSKAQVAAKARAEAAAELATEELIQMMPDRGNRAHIFNTFLIETLRVENDMLKLFGPVRYLNYGQ